MHILLLLLLGFALSILVWWLMTDDDAAAPVDAALPTTEAAEPSESASVATPTRPPRHRLVVVQWSHKAFAQMYFRTKAFATVFRARLLSTPTRGRK